MDLSHPRSLSGRLLLQLLSGQSLLLLLGLSHLPRLSGRLLLLLLSGQSLLFPSGLSYPQDQSDLLLLLLLSVPLHPLDRWLLLGLLHLPHQLLPLVPLLLPVPLLLLPSGLSHPQDQSGRLLL